MNVTVAWPTINEWEDCVGVVVVVKVGIGTWETQVLSEDSWWHCFMLTCYYGQRTQNCGSVFCVFAFVFQVLAIDCFGTNLTHAQTCDNVPVPSATPWTASVHAQHMPKPVITFVFKVLRNGLLRYKLDTWLFSTNSFQRLNTKNADSWRRLLVRRDVYVCIMIALYVFFSFLHTHVRSDRSVHNNMCIYTHLLHWNIHVSLYLGVLLMWSQQNIIAAPITSLGFWMGNGFLDGECKRRFWFLLQGQ